MCGEVKKDNAEPWVLAMQYIYNKTGWTSPLGSPKPHQLFLSSLRRQDAPLSLGYKGTTGAPSPTARHVG